MADEHTQHSPLLPSEWLQDPREWLDSPDAWPDGSASAAEPATASPRGPAHAAKAYGVRTRRWSREYAGYLAAGAMALTVLVCSVTALSQAGMRWHSAVPVGAVGPSLAPSSATGSAPATTGSSAAVPLVPPATSPSATTSRRAVKRTLSSAKPRTGSAPAGSRAPSTKSKSPTPTGLELLGPVDTGALWGMVNDYCVRSFRGYAVLRWPDGNAVDNWTCQRWEWSGMESKPVDMTAACVQRYGRDAVAKYLDSADVYSWRCYRA